MKKLEGLKLHELSKAEMAKKEQNLIKGGYDLPEIIVTPCNCGCRYEGSKSGPDDCCYGGSSSSANFRANNG